MCEHDDGQDGCYFDDHDPQESECDDDDRQDWIRLGDGPFMVCHTLLNGRMLVGYAVRQPAAGYRLTMPGLPAGRPVPGESLPRPCLLHKAPDRLCKSDDLRRCLCRVWLAIGE
jgi:hypothetical protein